MDRFTNIKKRVTYYLVPKTTSFNLPTYEKLIEYSIIDTNDINDIIDTNDINDKNNSTSSIIDISKNPFENKNNSNNYINSTINPGLECSGVGCVGKRRRERELLLQKN